MVLSPEQMDRAMDEHFAYEAADDIEGVLTTPCSPTWRRARSKP
jgi:hypothetical protein